MLQQFGIPQRWIVLAAAFWVTFLAFGTAFGFGSVLQALQSEFGAGRGAVSFVFSCSGFLYLGLAIVAGPLADRVGTRPLVVAGMALAALGLGVASLGSALWHVCLAYGLGVGIGVGVLYAPTVRIAQAYFPDRRGLAAGIVASGIALGTVVLPRLTAWLTATQNWRVAFLVLAGLLLSVGIGAAGLLRPVPRSAQSRPVDDASGGLKAVWRSDGVRLTFAAAVIASFGVYTPYLHLPAAARDAGLSESDAVALIGWLGVGSLIGRLTLGGLADRLGHQSAFAVCIFGMLLATLAWSSGQIAGAMFGAIALCFGIAYGGYVALLPVLAAQHAGQGGKDMGAAVGLILSSNAVGILFGPLLTGAAYDLTGSYGASALASALCFAAAIACMLSLRTARPDRSGALRVRARIAVGPSADRA